MKRIIDDMVIFGYMVAVLFCCMACDGKIEVQQAYGFLLTTMPVQKRINRVKRLKYDCNCISRETTRKRSSSFPTSNPTGVGACGWMTRRYLLPMISTR